MNFCDWNPEAVTPLEMDYLAIGGKESVEQCHRYIVGGATFSVKNTEFAPYLSPVNPGSERTRRNEVVGNHCQFFPAACRVMSNLYLRHLRNSRVGPVARGFLGSAAA